MGEVAARLSTVVFTDKNADAFAQELRQCLDSAGLKIERAAHEPQKDAMLGTPEVIVTIVVTSAARAIAVAGLNLLGKYLEQKIGANPGDNRLQIVLVGESNSPRRFPLGLRSATVDAINEFITRVKAAIEKL